MSLRALLIVSLVCNVALGSAIVWRRGFLPGANARESLAPARSPTPRTDEPTLPSATTWSRLSEGTLADLDARLRAEKVPASIRRAIAIAQLQQRFAARRAAIAALQLNLPYWQTEPQDMYRDPRVALERRALEREFNAQLQQVMAPGTSGLTSIQRDELRRNFGNPPDDKIERLRALQVDYDELAALVRAEAKHRLQPSDYEKLAELERQRRADVAALLSPTELENFEVRVSPTAKRLSSELHAFNFTDEEFRALFRVQQTIDARFGTSEELSFASSDHRREARVERETAFLATLGPERFADYQRSTTPGFLQTKRFVIELGLPLAAVAEVITIQRDITGRAASLHTNPNLTAAERQAQLAALSREASSRLTASLGESAVKSYRSRAGQWLHDLPSAVSADSMP